MTPTVDAIAAMRAKWPGHRWFAPGGLYGRPLAWGESPAVATVDTVAVAVDTCPDRLSCQCREPITCRLYGDVTKADCRRCAAARLAGGPWRPARAIGGPKGPFPGSCAQSGP